MTGSFIKSHPYHLINPSNLPFLISIITCFFIPSVIFYLHQTFYSNAFPFLILFVLILITFTAKWWSEVIKESFLLFHNFIVKKGLKVGFALFIVSEIMFFFGFFWAYFYNALSPSIFVGAIWPPFAINPFNPFGLPLANTGILITSGITITYTHMFMNTGNFKEAKEGFLITLYLAVLFIFIQYQEFYHAPFSISDGIYGSTFFMITGLHGFHVIIGTIFIYICYLRYQISIAEKNFDISKIQQPLKAIFLNNGSHTSPYITSAVPTGFILAAWYWHFVDAVWIFVYLFLYVFCYI